MVLSERSDTVEGSNSPRLAGVRRREDEAELYFQRRGAS